MKHYETYPKGDFPIYLAYAFRPVFLILPFYIVLSIVLWAFVFTGYIHLPINDILNWHIYEMIFGVGSAMIIAFFLTALPEIFIGVKPIVGKKLAYIVALWLLGRLGFWFMDFFGVYIVGFLNISLISYILYLLTIFAFQDPNKKHISLVFSIFSILVVQIVYFLSIAKIINISSYEVLFLSLGLFLILILLALRRISMGTINSFLEQQQIDETFLAKPFRYNIAIFCILLYSFVEFFFPNNSTLIYICFACSSSILALLNDFILKENNILFKPFILYLVSTLVLTAVGFLFLGFNYLFELNALNHFRHLLTTGTFGMVFYIVMIIISTVHTGRDIFTNWALNLGLILIIIATLIRSFIPYYYDYISLAYIVSSIMWAIPFIIYIKIFARFLLNSRADGMKG